MEPAGGELYHGRAVAMLQAVWGEGFLSPGGLQKWRGSLVMPTSPGLPCSISGAARAGSTWRWCATMAPVT